MNRLKILVLFGSLLLWSCDKFEKNELYSRPEWLKGTLYDQLKADTSKYLIYAKALEITGYADKLGRTGSYTLFVPTDAAFNTFLGSYGGDVNKVPADLLKGIIEFSILNFSLTRDLLTAYNEWGYWNKDSNKSFKKKTYYQKPNYTEDGKMVYNQLKYIPIYTAEYFNTIGVAGFESLTYQFLYPTTVWNKSGLLANIYDANFVSDGVPAENGIFYGIDKVIVPLNNIAEELAVDSRSSVMFSLFSRFREFAYSEYATVNTGSADKLYYKRYSGSRPVELTTTITDIDIDINEENINSGYSEQAAMYAAHTAFAPSNAKMNQHLAKYDGVPPRPALRLLLNNHFIKNSVQYPKQLTKDGSPHKYLFDQNLIVGQKVVSNGLIYFIDDILEPNVFKGVTAPIFFKSKYSKFMYALEKVDQTLQLSDGTTQFYLFAFDNAKLTSMGIEYDESTDTFTKNGTRWAVSTNIKAISKDSVRVLVERHIAKGPLKGGYAKTLAGEFVEVDMANNLIKSDNVSLTFNEKTVAANGTGYTFSMNDKLPVQQDNMAFLKTNFPKFYNLLIRSGFTTLYDEYTAFIIPDSKIVYGTAPFDMLKADGTINSAVPNAQLRLIDIVNSHLVTQTLFTSDNLVYGIKKTKNGKSITFNGGNIVDSAGTINIDAQKRNITKASGVVLHLIDRVMVPN
jgi:uncharacterized surface protein with fasciclin (FAS1) repeats